MGRLAVVIGALGLAACFSRLDERALTSGADAGGPDLAGGDLADADGGVLDGGTTICDDFTGDPLDGGADGWTAFSGTWRVQAIGGGGRALAQLNPANNGNLYRVWSGSIAWRRVALSATILPAGGMFSECVMVRVIDKDHHYRFCLENGARWRLLKADGTTTTSLLSAAFPYGMERHLLSVQAVGSKLSVAVDNAAPLSVTDALFDRGAIGLATETTSAFTNVCVTVP